MQILKRLKKVFAWMLALTLAMAWTFPGGTLVALAAENSALFYDGAQSERKTPQEILSGMTTEEKITQMLMPTFRYYKDEEGKTRGVTEMRDDIRDMLTRYAFGGTILFSQNAAENAQTLRLVDDMQKANALPDRTQLLVAVDQEGGRVARLGQGTQMPGNMALGAAGDVAMTERAAEIMGKEITALGMNLDMAPVQPLQPRDWNPLLFGQS